MYYYHYRDQVRTMDDEMKAKFTEAVNTLAAMGERVLGFAQLYVDAEKFPPGTHTVLGSVSPF
jgi:uncharacterized cupin superfamily protein